MSIGGSVIEKGDCVDRAGESKMGRVVGCRCSSVARDRVSHP